MRRTAVVVGLALGMLTAAGSASAADEPAGLASQGQFIFSADRLFSVLSYQDEKAGPDTATVSSSRTQIGLFSGLNGANFFTVPRLGFDYTITPNITLGGSLFVYTELGASTTTSNGTQSVSNPDPKVTYWGLAPRAGYILPITDSFSFWGRLGFSFIEGTASTPSSTMTVGNQTVTVQSSSASKSIWAVDVEPMFVYSPVNHFGFVFGPTVDIPLTGSNSQTSNGMTVSNNQAYFYLGVQGGLLGYF
jgi:opacity protein-like surface antigen